MMMSPEDPHLARLRQLYAGFEQFPGSAPGGTGETGLNSNDAQGWSDLLNRQSEAANIQREMAGKGPLQVRGYSHPMPESNLPSTNWEASQTSSVPTATPALQGLQIASGKRRRR